MGSLTRALLLALALAGCSSSPAASAPDLSAPRPCASGTAPLSDFESGTEFGFCHATYAAERAAVNCQLLGASTAACGTLDVVDTSSVASDQQCFYDHASGALVAAWGFLDTAGSCAAGDAHDRCAGLGWSSLCSPDGGS